MPKITIQPAIEFDAELRGDVIHCELSCDSCTGTRCEIVYTGAARENLDEIISGKTIDCAACGASVVLGPAIKQVLDG